MTGPRSGGNYPARLGVHNLGGATVAVAHITDARIENFGGNYLDKSNQKVALTYAEFPGVQHVLNATSYRLLAARYGEPARGDYRAWVGKVVVLNVVDADNFREGTKVKSVWIADDQTWTKVYAQWSRASAPVPGVAGAPAPAAEAVTEAPKPRRRPAKKAAKKSTE